jgi:hypothetical protein
MTSTVAETATIYFQLTLDYEFKNPLDDAVVGAALLEYREKHSNPPKSEQFLDCVTPTQAPSVPPARAGRR